MSEVLLKRDVCEWLRKNKILHWPVYVGPVLSSGIRKKNPMRGFPDIFGVIPDTEGRMFTIELKVGKNKVSDHQKEVMDKLEKERVLVIVAYSLRDVVVNFNSLS